jgi:type I restriction enzyme M protein
LKEARGLMRLAKRDSAFGDWQSHQLAAQRIETQLARHKALEDEARQLNILIKATEKSRDELVARARLKISNDEARVAIVERLGNVLFESYRHYLRADRRACITAIESLWTKYAITATQIEVAREEAEVALKAYLLELGYA